MSFTRFRYTIQLDESGVSPPEPTTARAGAEWQRDEFDAEQKPAYLLDVPTMNDFLAHLAGYPKLTQAEEDCIGKQIRQLREQVRAARTKWERSQDVVDCP